MQKYVAVQVKPTVSITPNLTAEDVVFDTVTLSGVGAIEGGTVILRGIQIKDDSASAPRTTRFIFFRTDVKLGTPNETPDLEDSEGDQVIACADFMEFERSTPTSEILYSTGAMVLGFQDFAHHLILGAATKDLYVACQSIGATYNFANTDDFVVKFFFERATMPLDSIFV